ncbi:uncharacterized protein LOC135072317 [Ostrinia nubilalis]|uniref:uncharacterized protein LOC135072317 n=1 Tax=Ostrinia nubilalis TaxID=29057 RepID=UPI003082243D
MGKRKHDRYNSKIRRKIRRLEQKLRDSISSTDGENENFNSRSPSPQPVFLSSQSEHSDGDSQIKSCVVSVDGPTDTNNIPATAANLLAQEPGNSSGTVPDSVLPPEILDALGDPVGKDEVLGAPINDEIAKRWGRVLVEGMTKDAKENIMKQTLIPENFVLSKAPKLNLEISAVLSDSMKQRDKLFEKAQNQLGLAIAGFSSLASSLIKEDLSKIEILKRLSEISQILLDLHHENTKQRRKLITTSLDKRFNTAITDVKRDAFLFGANLGDTIKATKSAERSGLQIKRSNVAVPSTSKQQGNWRGPPRYQATKAPKPGGQKPRYTTTQGYTTSQGRRPQPTTSRAHQVQKTDQRTRRNN